MHPAPTTRNRPPAATLAALAAAALVGAVVPAAAGLAFLISLAVRRPLIAVAARRWPWLTGRPAGRLPGRAITGLTAAWGIGMLAAAAVQGAGALTGGLALTSPASLAARALIALAVEAILAAITIAWLHRSSGGGRAEPERERMILSGPTASALIGGAGGIGGDGRPADTGKAGRAAGAGDKR